MPTKLRHSKYEIITVDIKFLHPSEDIKEKFTNCTISQCIDNYKVVRLDKKHQSKFTTGCCVGSRVVLG